MDSSDLLSTGQVGEFEGIFSDSSGGFFGDDLDAFNDTRVNFMFDVTVFSFSVFSDNDDINLLVSGGDARKGSSVSHIGIEVQFLVDLFVVHVVRSLSVRQSSQKDAFVLSELFQRDGIIQVKVVQNVPFDRAEGSFENLLDRS